MVENTSSHGRTERENNVAVADDVRMFDGQLYIPAAVRRSIEACYDRELRVTIPTPNAPTETVTFTNFVTTSGITIPSSVRHMANLGQFGRIDWVEFEETDHTRTREENHTVETDETDSLGENPGANPTEEALDELEENLDSLEETVDNVEVKSEDEEPTGLRDLFQ